MAREGKKKKNAWKFRAHLLLVQHLLLQLLSQLALLVDLFILHRNRRVVALVFVARHWHCTAAEVCSARQLRNSYWRTSISVIQWQLVNRGHRPITEGGHYITFRGDEKLHLEKYVLDDT